MTRRNVYRSKSRKTRKNAKSTANKLSELLLGANKLVRDVNAVQKGNIAGRLERRLLGREASKGLGSELLKFFRK